MNLMTSNRREREKNERRQLILETARTLFVEHGYDAVTLRKVAERIEYSTTAIYAHFKDKKALIEELVHQDMAAHMALFAEATTIADPVERLCELGRRYVAFGLELPNHYWLMFIAKRPGAGPTGPDKGSYSVLLSTVEDCIESGRVRPEFCDANALSLLMWSTVHGIVSLFISKGHMDAFTGWKPKETAELLLKAQLDGIFFRNSPELPKQP